MIIIIIGDEYLPHKSCRRLQVNCVHSWRGMQQPPFRCRKLTFLIAFGWRRQSRIPFCLQDLLDGRCALHFSGHRLMIPRRRRLTMLTKLRCWIRIAWSGLDRREYELVENNLLICLPMTPIFVSPEKSYSALCGNYDEWLRYCL